MEGEEEESENAQGLSLLVDLLPATLPKPGGKSFPSHLTKKVAGNGASFTLNGPTPSFASLGPGI